MERKRKEREDFCFVFRFSYFDDTRATGSQRTGSQANKGQFEHRRARWPLGWLRGICNGAKCWSFLFAPVSKECLSLSRLISSFDICSSYGSNFTAESSGISRPPAQRHSLGQGARSISTSPNHTCTSHAAPTLCKP